MAKTTTRDAALSRLFGADEEVSSEGGALEPDPVEHRAIESTSRDEATPAADAPQPLESAPLQREDPEIQRLAEVPPAEELVEGRSGYIGSGKYVREGGVFERITPYVRPDQAEALRVAVAKKRDPRGKDISQIVQTLLDEAGYRAPIG
jgi:hypothetical protein